MNLHLKLSHTKTLFPVLATLLAGWIFLIFSPWVPVAHASTVSPCSDDEVTVMVEGYPLACSPAGGNGWQTLINAGFSPEGTQKFPEFLCRINNYPDASVDKCLTASPSHAYWSYWHAPLDGDSWVYSDRGSLIHYSQPGTVEAWTWGAGLEPGAIPVSSPAPGEDSEADDFMDSESDSELNSESDSDEQSELYIPTIPIIPPLDNPLPTTPTTTAQNTEPETNPDDPNEVIVFLDAEGKRISRQEYEELRAAASQSAAPPVQTAPAPRPAAPVVPTVQARPETTAADTPDPKSTQVLRAPAVVAAAEPPEEAVIPQYSPTTAQAAGNSSPAWMIAVTVAFIILLGSATAATWVIRRGEIKG